MKKIILVFLPILLICNPIFSQEEEEQQKWAVKAYVNGSSTFFDDVVTTSEDGSVINTYSRNDITVGKVSPAISYTKGKLIQELELTDFSINRVRDLTISDFQQQNLTIATSGGKERQTSISLRYLASGVFRPFKSKKISLGIGGAAQPSFSRSKRVPSTSAEFITKHYTIGVGVAVVPQIEYDFFKRFFINISSPLEIFDISLSSFHNGNPLLPESERRTNVADADFFPKRYHLRMGLGVRF
ncbi:MAG: hypothetical protein ACI94Y_004345 [Maribacter sp.]|jgi:hypothetical protein